jgi:hypothetical protein
MAINPELMKKSTLQIVYLLVFPILLFTTGILYLNSTGLFFLKGVDPEYAYLFNGLLLADMKPDVDYVYHPGTPMLCVIATVIRLLHIFRPGEDVITDVIRNPETYIRTTIYAVSLLGSIMLFFLGSFTLRKTRNMLLALLIQLVPFTHNLSLEPLGRLIPESLMLSLICLWLMMLIRIVTDPDPVKNGIIHSLALGAIFGLSLANKLTFLPYVLIPLFILPGWKQKIRFTGTAILSFFVFAFPVLFKHQSFYNWVKNIIIHTGNYGSGDKGIVHLGEFTNHLTLLIHNTPWLWISWILLIMALLLYIIKTKKGINRVSWKIRLSAATIILVILQFIISAKQFAYHYMLPSILLTIPMIILSYSMVGTVLPTFTSRRTINLAMVVMIMLVLVNIIPRVNGQLHQMTANTRSKTDAYLQYAEFRPAGPIIISASYYGCSAVEYALMFGLHESGKYSPYLFEKIQAFYPSTYLYLPWGKVFFEGKNEIQPTAFIKPDKEYNLYIADFSEDRLEEIITRMRQDTSINQYSISPVYVDSIQHEAMFRVRFF